MKISESLKNKIVDVISLLYIVLFMYAATSKLLDFENFQVQLGQSPLLSAFAGWVSWFVILIEITISVCLIFKKSRLLALYCAFCLMTMFTAYIFIILHYSSFVPCSCGGILEKMNWQTHLFFNLLFTVLALFGLLLSPLKTTNVNKMNILSPFYLSGSFIICCGIVFILFLSSEDIMHRKNPFIRSYPHHPVTLLHTIDLKYNSYYLAGEGDGNVYLGNSTLPLSLLAIDSLTHRKTIKISIQSNTNLYKSHRIAVRPPYFYILDGQIPAIFKGMIADWVAKPQLSPPFFDIAVPMYGNSIAFRGSSLYTNENTIGFFRDVQKPAIVIAPDLLQKQIDGVFDTDGMLHYSPEIRMIVYLYTYRNQYIVADENGILHYRAHTIDTNTHAKIKVSYLKNKTERAMSAPAVDVNKTSFVYGHLLFVNSNVQGKYEPKETWKQASVIDVYNLNKREYLFSFHIYGIGNKKLRSFMLSRHYIYALIGNKLVVYKLNDKLQNEINSGAASKSFKNISALISGK